MKEIAGTSAIDFLKHNTISKRHQQLASAAGRSKNSLPKPAQMKVSTADSAGGEEPRFKERCRPVGMKHLISRVHG